MERLKPLVAGGSKGKRGPRTDNRRFLNALLWMARSGGRWCDLPERLGDYNTVKRRYYREGCCAARVLRDDDLAAAVETLHARGLGKMARTPIPVKREPNR